MEPIRQRHRGSKEFGLSFTKRYLKRYIPLTNDSIILKVSSPVRTKEYEVNMKLGIGTKKAIITSGWNHVKKLEELVMTTPPEKGQPVHLRPSNMYNAASSTLKQKKEKNLKETVMKTTTEEQKKNLENIRKHPEEDNTEVPAKRVKMDNCKNGTRINSEEEEDEGDYISEEDDYISEEDDYVSEEDDYVSEEDDYIPDDDDDDDETRRLTELTREYTKAFLLKFMLTNCMKRDVPIIEEVIPVVVNNTDSNLEKYCTMRLFLANSGSKFISLQCQRTGCMVAQYTWRTYDLYSEKTATRTTICGPYWRSMVRAYDIQVGDEVSFKYAKEDDIFDVTVHHHVDSGKEKKRLVSDPVVNDVNPHIRIALHKAIFSNINALTEQQMAAITFAISKEVYVQPTRELEDDEFYCSADNLKFFVHIYNEENVHFDALYLNPKYFNDGHCPVNGNVHMWKRGLNQSEVAWYHIEGDDHIAITVGWDHFREESNIVEGSLLMMKAVPTYEAIVLDFVEMMNP
ncbi:hypothetical protein ACQ4PT_000810 [Festuca glaucescens]